MRYAASYQRDQLRHLRRVVCGGTGVVDEDAVVGAVEAVALDVGDVDSDSDADEAGTDGDEAVYARHTHWYHPLPPHSLDHPHLNHRPNR